MIGKNNKWIVGLMLFSTISISVISDDRSSRSSILNKLDNKRRFNANGRRYIANKRKYTRSTSQVGKAEAGEVCVDNDECLNNDCRGQRCGGRKERAWCEADNWCISNNCYRSMCLEKDGYKAIGDTCEHRRECVSTRCSDGECVGRTNGEWCQKPEWCASNHCYKSRCADQPLDPCAYNHSKEKCTGDCAWSDGNCAYSDTHVSCGNHQAPSCDSCPCGHGASWCGGNCAWSGGKCMLISDLPDPCSVITDKRVCLGDCAFSNDVCAHSTTFAWCGEHQAPSCALCPNGHGADWCSGECTWNRGECVETSTLPEVSLISKDFIYEKGYCVKSNGADQNNGVIKLQEGDFGPSEDSMNKCLDMCISSSANVRLTGCEAIWGQGNSGCYIHTMEAAMGNNVDRHACWIVDEGWTKVYGHGSMSTGDTMVDLWKSIDKGSYVRRICLSCNHNKDIIYKRITSSAIDFEDLFLSNWFNNPDGGSNNLGSDFKLFSNMNDATINNNAWTFCNYNDGGIGFPRDCGPNGFIPSTWNSMNRGGQADYAYYVYTDKSKAQEYPGWTQLFGRGDLTSINTKPDLWKSIHQGSYVRRVCTTCQDSHKDVIYKRLTAVGSIDFEDLFLSNWFDHPNGGGNVLGSDFKLFSNMNDATSNNNAWTFCNYNDDGIGFPRDCGPNGHVACTWNSMTYSYDDCGTSSYAYYIYTASAEWTQLYGSGTLAKGKAIKPEMWKSIDQGSYIGRVCAGCPSTHQYIIYKRMTSGTIDYEKLFLSDWFNYPHGGSNNLGSDFNLFSSMEDAKNNKNAWTFCNYNDAGIGFPRDCGPNGHVAYTWNSLNRGGQADYGYFLYTGTAHEYSGWTQVFGRGTMACLDTKADIWNSIKQGSYVRRVCPGCQLNHKDIIYKRLTPVDNIDFEDLFLSNWFDNPNGGSNILGSDFKLFSNMDDAKSNNNAWTFCNYNDPGIGFPRDCGPNGYVPCTWNSITRDHYPCGTTSYAYYVYTGEAQAQVTTQVAFTVKRSAGYTNVITFTKESGVGPNEIVFGPNPSTYSTKTVTAEMSPGTSYVLKSVTVNGNTGVGELRLNGDQLQLEDIKGNNSWDDIVVTPSKGMFTSKNRFTLPLDHSRVLK